VTAEAASRAPAGEASFRLLAEHLGGECRRLETRGNKDPSRLWAQLFVPRPGRRTVVEARLPLTDPAEWRWGA
jgi:hypothetical protein